MAFDVAEEARSGNGPAVDERAITKALRAREERMRRLGYSEARIRAVLLTLGDWMRGVERAKAIQRCAHRHERDVVEQRRVGDPKDPNPRVESVVVGRHVGDPCGGRLRREGGLLTCQICGRTAPG